VHTLGAPWLYLERWQGRSPRAMPEPAQFAGLAAIRNHATQHRSEAAMLLTKLGHSPGWLGLLYFVDLEAAGSPET
jgi:uncharacterized damage-inducible protein DinB